MTLSSSSATTGYKLESLNYSERLELLSLLTEQEKRRKENQLREYRPYAKQKLFHAKGLTCTERLLRAGNQQGKTHAGGCEMAMHLTGEYPDWWEGRRFNHGVEAWAACDTGESTRDNPQRVLMGNIGAWGTGTIPARTLVNWWSGRGVANLLDTIVVRHVSGETSRLGFKRYDQGREAWQGPPKHVIWCDEEAPETLYSEALARLTATRGIIYTTFTPLKGSTGLVKRLMAPGDGKADINMTIEDAEHIPADERAAIIARYPAHERKARALGIPFLGSGNVFPVDEDAIRCKPFPIPDWWPCVGGLDFGWDHPFAAVRLAWDRDADCVYVSHIYRQRETTPLVHSAALKPWGDWFPWAWPHDGLQHDKASGKPLSQHYREHGLHMHFEHAQHEVNADGSGGGIGLEAGVTSMLERMQTGRLKVFETCGEWFEEFRTYHRKEGLIVPIDDDLMSATRYALMMLRIAQGKKPEPIMDKYARRRKKEQGSQWAQ